MLSFITEVWMSNLFGAIYLLVGIVVGVNLLKYIDPSAWAVLLHTSKDDKWAYYIDKNGDKETASAAMIDKVFNLIGLLVMIIFWPAIIVIVIMYKLIKYSITDIIPYCLIKIPTFTIKLEKEKRE